mgnify:CR=1 FL=1
MNPNVYAPQCLNAVGSFLNGGSTDLEAACWPERVQVQAANSPECKKLKADYNIAEAERSVAMAGMNYSEAGAIKSEADSLKLSMEEAHCAF